MSILNIIVGLLCAVLAACSLRFEWSLFDASLLVLGIANLCVGVALLCK